MTAESVLSPGHVAVITGAASGIGRATCRRFAEMGMKVCLADLPGDDLDDARREIAGASADGDAGVLAVPTDVADPGQIQHLHDRVIDRLGKVHLLMNNAVTREGRGHDADIESWRRAIEVNLWGVINGVRIFLPTMQQAAEPGMIINVGSKQGITNPPGHPIYNIAKSAIKTYTESLEHQLRSADGPKNISAHLLVPGWTTTGKNQHKQGAWLPDEVIDYMLKALAQGSFYIICPDDEVTSEMDRKRIIWGAEDITKNRPPLSRWHPDFAEAAKTVCS